METLFKEETIWECSSVELERCPVTAEVVGSSPIIPANLESKMNTEEQERKVTLDHMIDEKFGEIFFIAKEEFDIAAKSKEERKLYDFLDKFKSKLKKKCKSHFESDEL